MKNDMADLCKIRHSMLCLSLDSPRLQFLPNRVLNAQV